VGSSLTLPELPAWAPEHEAKPIKRFDTDGFLRYVVEIGVAAGAGHSWCPSIEARALARAVAPQSQSASEAGNNTAQTERCPTPFSSSWRHGSVLNHHVFAASMIRLLDASRASASSARRAACRR